MGLGFPTRAATLWRRKQLLDAALRPERPSAEQNTSGDQNPDRDREEKESKKKGKEKRKKERNNEEGIKMQTHIVVVLQVKATKSVQNPHDEREMQEKGPEPQPTR
jgi:hypothetical protein